MNQKVALSYLSRMGYAADVAATGREALEAVRRESYDVVLMDVQMPEMDGFEATRRIRALGPGEKEPWIVAVTASAMTGDPEKCLAAGMNDYLSKPVRVEELAAALRRAPRRTQRRPPASALPVLVPGPLEALRSLERPGEEEFVASLLVIFRRDTPLRIEEMERSATAADAESFRRAAHSLKSSAASLGGARVGGSLRPGWRPSRRPTARGCGLRRGRRSSCPALAEAEDAPASPSTGLGRSDPASAAPVPGDRLSDAQRPRRARAGSGFL